MTLAFEEQVEYKIHRWLFRSYVLQEGTMADQFVVVDTVSGRTEAEFLRSFLRARGIQCVISQEAVGWIYGFGVGPLASVEILVPSHQSKEARAAIKEYRKSNG